MVEIPDSLTSLFSGRVEERGGRYVVEVPREEVERDAIRAGSTYRIGVLTQPGNGDGGDGETHEERTTKSDRVPEPPVDKGEVRTVSVESVGDQGDGIAKVDRGYVVIVPDANPGDEPTVEIEEVKQNVAFARVVE